MDRQLVSHSKFLSLVLRHSPETIGITLDESGWTPIECLIDAANQSGRKLDHDTLLRVVHENDKQRFAISEDGLRIRANQGHSVEVDLKLEAQKPPEILYHGTVAKFIDGIKAKGLVSGSRQHVHLSSDVKTANLVGTRRGRPIILSVQATRMHNDGLPFYLSKNGVWLTDHVPPQYLEFSDS